MKSSFHFPSEGPYEVWNRLHSGIDIAVSDQDVLGDEERNLVDAIGSIIAKSKTEFLLEPHGESVLSLLEPFLAHPWIRHATEIVIAYEGVERLGATLERLLELRPVLAKHRIGEKPARYLEEVINVYVYGFYGAALAMAGATLEQIMAEVLVQRGVLTFEDIYGKPIGAGRLLAECAETGLINETKDLASRILDERNRIMHRHIWDDRIAQQRALQSSDQLGAVITELGGIAGAEHGT